MKKTKQQASGKESSAEKCKKDEIELRKKTEDYVKEQGFKLNPDDKIVNFVIKGLLNNKKKHGELYCPCRRVTGNKDEDMKIICPCIYHISEIKEQGHCHCNLLFK